MIATLPMYERPETITAHDRYWTLIASHLRTNGINAPDILNRDLDLWAAWQSPDLLLAQTCGLPYRARLADRVTLVGTPDFGLDGLPPGYYRSVLVTRADDPRSPEQIAGASGRLAYNEPLSQSGWAAVQGAGLTFTALLRTGAHRNSARAVAEGEADIAALDAVTWRLIERHEPELAAALRVAGETPATPGLPYITAQGRDPEPIAAAISTAIDVLSPTDRDTLGLRGLVRIDRETYLAQPLPVPPPDKTAA